MNVTYDWLQRLRRKVMDESALLDLDEDKVGIAFDRAALSALCVLLGVDPSLSQTASQALTRGQKAARTRAINKRKKEKLAAEQKVDGAEVSA